MAGAGWLEEQPEGLTTDLVMDDQPVRAVLNLKRAGLRDNHALESDLVENAQGLVYLLEGHDFVSCFAAAAGIKGIQYIHHSMNNIYIIA